MTVTAPVLTPVLGHYRNTCHYCQGSFWVDFITRDHIVPRARGGVNADWNIVPACSQCNVAKAADRPTCSCDWCQTAIRRHRGRRVNYPNGPECPQCGCITMTPNDCPWCGYKAGIA